MQQRWDGHVAEIAGTKKEISHLNVKKMEKIICKLCFVEGHCEVVKMPEVWCG
jgi:hypothetical protein